MSRPITTGRFETRAELEAMVVSMYQDSRRKQTQIARLCRVSEGTVAKILSGSSLAHVRPGRSNARMSNHPNRGKGGKSSTPSPERILAAREAVGMSQKDAGELVHGSERSWQDWERGERRMHPGIWELFLIKTGQRGE